MTRSWQASDFVGNALPLSLNGVIVQIHGVPAAISYVSPGQVNAQVPDGLPTGRSLDQLTITIGGVPAGVQFAGLSEAGVYQIN